MKLIISINKTKSILINDSDEDFEKINRRLADLKSEKIRLLEKEGLNESYLKLKYNCEKCLDTGFIKFDNKKSEMCSCLKQRLINISYNKSNLSNLRKENFEEFDLNKFSDKVDLEKTK